MALIPVINSDGMTVEKGLICKCDQCGHRWLPEDQDKEPERCAKCKSRTWNRKRYKWGEKPKKPGKAGRPRKSTARASRRRK